MLDSLLGDYNKDTESSQKAMGYSNHKLGLHTRKMSNCRRVLLLDLQLMF